MAASMYVHRCGTVGFQQRLTTGGMRLCPPCSLMVGNPQQRAVCARATLLCPSEYAVLLDVSNVFGKAWGTSVDVSTLASTVAPQIFAFSIFPYAGFLYCLTKSGKTPPIALGGTGIGCGAPVCCTVHTRITTTTTTTTTTTGFYFLLAFVFATIPAGIYAKQAYGTTLANVDWLHGSAESLLTVTNLLVCVCVLRRCCVWCVFWGHVVYMVCVFGVCCTWCVYCVCTTCCMFITCFI